MSIKVRSDEVARMYSTAGCIYKPKVHMIIENDWIRCARRHTHRPNLFLYYHRKARNFVLAHWVVRPKEGKGPGLMMELEVWANGTPKPTITYVRARCKPITDIMKDYDKQMAAEAYEETIAQDETEIQRKDIIRWLDNKGLRYQELADAMRSGEMEFVGDREGGKQLQAMKEALS